MKARLQIVWYAIVGLLLAGCAGFQPPYIPAKIGSLQDGESADSLEITIKPTEDSIAIGEPIVFQIILRNVGTQSFWIPKDPTMLFTWVYPNGSHDNFLREFESERYYSEDEVVLLAPGDEIKKYFLIKTYYFSITGITEFRATIHAGKNTNPALNPFWYGKIRSNAYGITVHRLKRRPGTSALIHSSEFSRLATARLSSSL